MDFAKKQLEKYGWKEGKGLGKNETGITTPIKPKLKFDKDGVGHKRGTEFTDHWWENVYNQSSDNVKVKVSENKTEFTVKNTETQIAKRKVSKGYRNNFVKTSTLTDEGEIQHEKADESVSLSEIAPGTALTDDELFAACSGRTAHKGARHGLKLNGKLKRLQEQEAAFLKHQKLK